VFLACLVASGCAQARGPLTTPVQEEAGAVFIYLSPFPREAARLAFRLQDVSAVQEDGAAVPLPLLLHDAVGAEPNRERRLAGGDLPPGRYSALAIRVTAASFRGEEGPAALLPPPEPVTVPVLFTVEKRRAVVLSLRLDYRGSIDAGFRFAPVFSAAIAPRPAPGLLGLASSRMANVVTLFDKVSGQVVGAVLTGLRPTGLAVDSDRHRAYVADAGESTVEAIGLLEQRVVSRLRLRGGDEPVELALTPDGRTLLSANAGSSTVSVIDALSLFEVARVQVGNSPTSVTVDRSGTRAYAFNSGSSTITAIDIASRAVAGTIGTEAGPLRGHFSRAGDRLYVIHRSSPYLTIVDPPALAVSGKVYVGPGAMALKVDAQTDRIYLARRNTGSVEIFDPLSLLPVDSIPIEADGAYLAIDGEENNLYIVLSRKNEVQVIRIVGQETVARIEVGEDPYGLALSGER